MTDDRRDFDLKDPDLHCSPRGHGIFRKLRKDSPVYWNPEAAGPGFWAVTRYQDALEVVQNPEIYSADVSNGGMRIFDIQTVTAKPSAHLLSMDPPQHSQLRKALQPLFSPANISRLDKRIRRRAMRLVDAIAPNGEAEFVSEVAAPLTLGLLVDLLDVPEEDADRLLHWSNVFIGDDDPALQPSLETREQAIRDMDAYAWELYDARQTPDALDFCSILRQSRIDDQPLDFEAFSVNFGAFLIAANETTRHSISAAMIALTEHPDEKNRLVARPDLIPVAVKEFVRWATPLMHVRRTATRETQLGGRKIRRGDKVVVWYSSANRDEATWPDADKFDVTRYASREAARHLGFGAGPHHCLGWRFAELQLAAIFSELLSRLPDIRFAGPPRPMRSNFIAGINALPVSFTPERPTLSRP